MDIRLHPAYEAAITRIEDLKLTLATAYSQLSDLQTTQVPFTEARYMATIGRYELTAYELYMTVQFLKKRRQLMLQAINQGETPDLEAIEIEINLLNGQLDVKRQELADRLRRAQHIWDAKLLSVEDTKSLKMIYRELVRLLHPDLNPDQTAVEREWFQAAVTAYKAGQLQELALLLEIVQLNNQAAEQHEVVMPIEDLQEQGDQLASKIDTLQAEIDRIMTSFPMYLADALQDDNYITEQVLRIQQQTTRLMAKRSQLLTDLAQMGWVPHD